MIQLYDYQQDIIKKTRTQLAKKEKHILVQSPTGSGKTVIFSYIISEMKKKGKRALILTDRIELLFETGGTLEQFGLVPYHIVAGQMVEPPAQFQVYVGMSQTIRLRFDKWRNFWNWFDIVIIDEAHKQEFNPFFEQEKFKCPILGFTATPVRTGKQRQLFQDYNVMIEGLQVPELIKRGKLVKDKYYGFQGIETNGAKYNSQGDYSESWMFDKFNKTELYSGVVENWQKICPETSTLVFCVNIQHTIETCKAFNDAGIKAKFLVSSVPLPQLTNESDEAKRVIYERKKKEYDNYVINYQLYSGERKSIVRQWCEHKFEVLINAGILTTGFNRKDLQTVIVDRATTSVALWLQMIGRGSRPYPGKEFFNILDFGGNGQRLGYYNQQRRWSLVHETRESGGEPPVKECGKDYKPDENGNTGCQAYVFVSAKICPFCGYVFEKEKQEKFVELEHIDYTIDITPEETHEEEFQNWERIAESRGYKAAWVIPQIINKFGSDGLLEYSKYKRYQSSWYWLTKQRFSKLIDNYNEKNI